MKVYIENKEGFLDGYSLNEQPKLVEVTTRKEPIDFTNWRYDGTKLVHDPKNAPVVEQELNELERLKKENNELKAENKEIKERQDTTEASVMELASYVLAGGEE